MRRKFSVEAQGKSDEWPDIELNKGVAALRVRPQTPKLPTCKTKSLKKLSKYSINKPKLIQMNSNRGLGFMPTCQPHCSGFRVMQGTKSKRGCELFL